MSDYFSRFKGATPELVQARDKRKELTRSLKKAQSRLVDEQVAKAKVLKQVQKLKEKTADNYHDSAIEDFQRKLQRLNMELFNSDNVIEMLETVIRKAQTDIANIKTNIRLMLMAFYRKNLDAPNEAIQGFLNAAEAERESYVDDFKRIFEDFNETLVISAEELLPGSWGARETLAVESGVQVQKEPEPKAETPKPLQCIKEFVSPKPVEPETFEDAGGGMAVKGSKAFEDNQNIG